MMNLQQFPILTLLLLLPLAGVIAILLTPAQRVKWLRIAAITVAILPAFIAVLLFADYDNYRGHTHYNQQADWISIPFHTQTHMGVQDAVFTLQYTVGIDGTSLLMLVLTTIVFAMACLAGIQIKKRRKAFYAWFFILEFAVLGAFMAQDIFLFFGFLQIVIVAAYFLIGIWGFFNRERAANSFLIAHSISSALLLFVFVCLVIVAGYRIEDTDGALQLVYSGQYQTIFQQLSSADIELSGAMQHTLFVLLLLAFGIQMPIFPLHTWVIQVHKAASHPFLMLYVAVLLKLGAFGMLRYGLLLFPEEAKQNALLLAILGLISLLHGAIAAVRQQDFKLVLAYFTVSQTGLMLLGLATMNEIGMEGAIIQMASHGFITALLFLIVGTLYERTQTMELEQLGGLARSMPFIGGLLLVAGFAMAGVPGLSGFLGVLLTLLGVMESMKPVAFIAALSLVFTAAYVMRGILRITYGKQREQYAAKKDARLVEALPMIVLLSIIVVIGCYPAIVTDRLGYSITTYIQHLLTLRTGG